METERPSPRYAAIDAWLPADILDAMIEGQFSAVAAVRAARGPIEQAAIALEQRLRAGGRLIYAGSGTSGRLAAQDGAELLPTFGWPAERVIVLMAGGHEALLKAIEGAEDDTGEAVRLVRHHGIGAEDGLIAVAASGTTPFTVACLEQAKAQGALTVAIANNARTALLDAGDHAIWLDTGPEPIAGSTRIKAGTAQRIALGLISSLVMIRLGKVHAGLMVDVQATNAKLVRRSETILRQLTDRDAADIRAALDRAQGQVKLALLLLHGLTPDDAAALLDRAGGHLRTALALLAQSPAKQSDAPADPSDQARQERKN
ncbi:MAG TPA: N-acetylmuramic acid 6-phosphate etherase [Aestuariivirgaceae bacterium]|nr:N-acetylmuramic acid 6-phosphate etherase [Aestuariivirgaceae bacterium]